MPESSTKPLFRRTLRALLSRAAETKLGWDLILAAVQADEGEIQFANVSDWPAGLRGFDDLVFLFNITGLNQGGLISQNIDEAAYLYRLVHELGAATIVEIGRFKGGSSFLIAAAMRPGSKLHSYDAHVELPPGVTGDLIDSALTDALRRYGLEKDVELVVGDSTQVPQPPGSYDLVFIDGDHSYEGGRSDFERWGKRVRSGGDLLFHDAAPPTVYPTSHQYPGIQRLADEIEREGLFTRERRVGSMVHFRRLNGQHDHGSR